ncbi:MAG: hypothetical protein ABI760_21870 [Ferruginibacter sp.]
MANKKFRSVRLNALKLWNRELGRSRRFGALSDDYSKSEWCQIQGTCSENGKHCNFICSYCDWLDNISDQLRDERFDNLSTNTDYLVLFRYYTRILLIVSEITQDFIMINKIAKKLGSKEASEKDLEENILPVKELNRLSQFINTVCKHKSERNNLQVHNHHLVIEFEDFNEMIHENQINFNNQDWNEMNSATTILMPKLTFFIEIIISLNNKILSNISNDTNFKNNLLDKYAINC